MIGGVNGEWSQFSIGTTARSSWAALAYLAVMGSLVAYLSYLYLLKKRPPAQVSTYVYINPVIAVFLGSLMANESINLVKIVALFIILAGVLLVNLPKYRFRTTKKFKYEYEH
jgi:drug/metabolite transporter (DMT)-like permease